MRRRALLSTLATAALPVAGCLSRTDDPGSDETTGDVPSPPEGESPTSETGGSDCPPVTDASLRDLLPTAEGFDRVAANEVSEAALDQSGAVAGLTAVYERVGGDTDDPLDDYRVRLARFGGRREARAWASEELTHLEFDSREDYAGAVAGAVGVVVYGPEESACVDLLEASPALGAGCPDRGTVTPRLTQTPHETGTERVVRTGSRNETVEADSQSPAHARRG